MAIVYNICDKLKQVINSSKPCELEVAIRSADTLKIFNSQTFLCLHIIYKHRWVGQQRFMSEVCLTITKDVWVLNQAYYDWLQNNINVIGYHATGQPALTLS